MLSEAYRGLSVALHHEDREFEAFLNRFRYADVVEPREA